MIDDPIAALERELVQAATARAYATIVGPRRVRRTGRIRRTGRVWGTGQVRRTGRVRRHAGAALTATASVLVVLAVGAALLLTRHATPPTAPARTAPSTAATPTRSNSLSILRRPQTAADRDAATLRTITQLERSSPSFKADIAGMRLAGTAPWGAKVVLVPFRVGGRRQLMVFVGGQLRGSGLEPRLGTLGTLGVVSLTTQIPEAGVVLVVPDGVARISLDLPGGPAVTAPVRHNVASLAVPGRRALNATVIWWSPSGRPINEVSLPALGPLTPLPSARTLVAQLGVLRRPQAPADLTLPALRQSSFDSPRVDAEVGTPVRSLIRRAAGAPWGGGIFLFPYAPPTRSQIATLPPAARANVQRTPMLGIFTATDGTGVPDSSIRRGNALVIEGGGVQAGRNLPLHVIMVVPDGVAKVAFTIQPLSGADTTVTIPVQNNVVTYESLHAPPTNPQLITWYGPHGHVLKRIRPAQAG